MSHMCLWFMVCYQWSPLRNLLSVQVVYGLPKNKIRSCRCKYGYMLCYESNPLETYLCAFGNYFLKAMLEG
jgi:hypothetical protein